MYHFKIPKFCLFKFFTNALYHYTTLAKKQWVKGLCCFLLALGFISQLSHHVGLIYSNTNSLPHHFFLHLKNVKTHRGHYTCFHSPWYGRSVIKQVIGMEGDRLSYDKDQNLHVDILDINSLWLGRQFLIGKPKNQSIDGRVLTPIKPGIIPKGMVFVCGDHERSFDSRYEELGLIPEKYLQGRLIALV